MAFTLGHVAVSASFDPTARTDGKLDYLTEAEQLRAKDAGGLYTAHAFALNPDAPEDCAELCAGLRALGLELVCVESEFLEKVLPDGFVSEDRRGGRRHLGRRLGRRRLELGELVHGEPRRHGCWWWGSASEVVALVVVIVFLCENFVTIRVRRALRCCGAAMRAC